MAHKIRADKSYSSARPPTQARTATVATAPGKGEAEWVLHRQRCLAQRRPGDTDDEERPTLIDVKPRQIERRVTAGIKEHHSSRVFGRSRSARGRNSQEDKHSHTDSESSRPAVPSISRHAGTAMSTLMPSAARPKT
jgi:hypothetical protein